MQASLDENRTKTLLGVSSAGFVTPVTVAVNPSTHAMLVEAIITPSGTQDVNLSEVGGAAIGLGQAVMANSIPVVIATDQTSINTAIPDGTTIHDSSTHTLEFVVNGDTSPGGGRGIIVYGSDGGTNYAPRIDSSGNQFNFIWDAQGNGRGAYVTAGNALVVDGSASIQPVSGSVDVTSVIPGTGATNLGKAEDAVHSSGDVGVMGLGVSNVAQTALAADGDYIPRAADTAGNTLVVGNVAAAATDSGNPVKVGAKQNTTLPTYTDGQRGDLQLSTRGALMTQLMTNNSNVAVTALADNADGVAVTATASRISVVNRNTIASPAGTVVWDRQYSVINATNSTGTGITAAGILGQFDDASPTAITENQFGNLRMSANRNLYGTIRDAAGNERGANVNASNQLSVSVDNFTPATSGGWLTFNATSGDGSTALTNSAQVIKASAGQIGGWYIFNPNSSTAYVPIYNVAAASVTVGTTNPQMVIALPAGAAANVEFMAGIQFTNVGFSVAATATAGGNGALSNSLEANFFYK